MYSRERRRMQVRVHNSFNCGAPMTRSRTPCQSPGQVTGEVHMAGKLAEDCRTMKRLPGPALARAIRVDAGATQARLAQELGVHWTTVARWEAGRRSPRGDLRLAYAQVLASLHEVAEIASSREGGV